MRYENIREGRFIFRPNRFIAEVEIEGEVCVCHVKNTGRCRELLIPGAKVYLEESKNPERSTKFDLVAVEKGERLINMDSQAPNKVVYEWIREGKFLDGIKAFKPECKFGSSRFDLYLETDSERIFGEVKGVTLEENGVVMFPDAPTERGVKHINELISATEQGYKAYIFFVIQMEECKYFTPNVRTHPEFADALRRAKEQGVSILALTCKVTPNSLEIKDFAEVRLN